MSNLPGDIAGLRAECKRRKIDPIGSKQELVGRLNADDVVKSRAFSVLAEKRPATTQDTAKPVVRHFNTSRTLKSVNDSSTIDFAYFPDLHASGIPDPYAFVRVPVLPDVSASISPRATEEVPVVMRPEINVMSMDRVFLPMAELSDDHAMNIDFHALADRVTSNLQRIKAPVEESAGAVKQLLNDMVDDVFGVKAKAAV